MEIFFNVYQHVFNILLSLINVMVCELKFFKVFLLYKLINLLMSCYSHSILYTFIGYTYV